jgi:hypothetical protein
LSGKNVGAVRRGEISHDGIGATAGCTDLVDHGLRLVGVAPIVNDDTRAGGGERQCGGTADSAGCAGDESGLIGEASHDGVLHAFGRGRPRWRRKMLQQAPALSADHEMNAPESSLACQS